MLFYKVQGQYGKTEYMDSMNDGKNKYRYTLGRAVILYTVDNEEFCDIFNVARYGIRRTNLKKIVYSCCQEMGIEEFNNKFTNAKAKILATYIFKLGSTQTTGLGYKKFGKRRG